MKTLDELLDPVHKLRNADYVPLGWYEAQLDQIEVNIRHMHEILTATHPPVSQDYLNWEQRVMGEACNCPPKQCEAAYGGQCATEEEVTA